MAVTKISEKFTDKKKKFNSYIHSPEVFDCDDFNIIKLFQYAIFREEGFNAKPYWKLPVFVISIIFWIRRWLRKYNTHTPFNISNHSEKQILIADSHRAVLDVKGQYRSRYFENVLHHLDREKILFINSTQIPSEIKHDFYLNNFYSFYSILPLTEDDKRLLKHLKNTYKKIIRTLQLDKNKQIILEEVIQIFWQEYRAYREFLKRFPNLKIAFVFPHYQKEPLIYALKRKGVKVIELQHGLIAEEDMFYVYDKNILPVKDKALFADEMWVYGKYWKEVLLKGYEYNEQQIKIFGYYLFYEKNFSDEFEKFANEIKSQFDKIIFATAQKNLEQHIAEYLNFLIKDAHSKKQNIAIIVKPHPSAAMDIEKLLNNEFQNVFVKNDPLEWLFQIADIHLSIYSTTLFDALMFNIKNNFAIKHPLFVDYVDNIVKQGIARELNLNENVLDKVYQQDNTNHHYSDTKYFYDDVNWQLLREAVK